MTTLIRHHNDSAASNLGLHCLPIPKVPNLDADSGDPNQTWCSDLSLYRLQMSLDKTNLNLGVSVLFCLM